MSKHSRSEVYLHFVWSTYRRLPLLTATVEQPVYAAILQEVRRSGCEVLAIGGVEDHVHVAVQMAPTVSASGLAKRMKGVSSHLARHQLPEQTFRWQTGFGVFSFSRSHRDRVVGYVQGQKRHHTSGELWEAWEETRMEA